MAAYLDAAEVTDEEARTQLLIDHARQVRDHIAALSRKDYAQHFSPSPEFVVMFLPGEMLFSAALQQDPQLIEYGASERVMPGDPDDADRAAARDRVRLAPAGARDECTGGRRSRQGALPSYRQTRRALDGSALDRAGGRRVQQERRHARVARARYRAQVPRSQGRARGRGDRGAGAGGYGAAADHGAGARRERADGSGADRAYRLDSAEAARHRQTRPPVVASASTVSSVAPRAMSATASTSCPALRSARTTAASQLSSARNRTASGGATRLRSSAGYAAREQPCRLRRRWLPGCLRV